MEGVMYSLILLGAFFVLATLGDWWSVLWHRYRERGEVAPAVALSMALEALTWGPVLFAMATEDYRVAVVCVAGSGLGCALGMRRKKAAPKGG